MKKISIIMVDLLNWMQIQTEVNDIFPSTPSQFSFVGKVVGKCSIQNQHFHHQLRGHIAMNENCPARTIHGYMICVLTLYF